MKESEAESLIPSANQGLAQPTWKNDDAPSANYNKISETIRCYTSNRLQCPAFCKGKNCKYDTPNCWPRDQMAINGVYSHWITEDIIAMSRPSAKVIETYSIIEQFQRKDYGVASVQRLLDMVKVITFSLTQGKVCIHCHAGLGRTGVLIACYLIYSLRCKPNDAIIYVRSKRDVFIKDFSIHQYLKRQKHILHGYEARHLKHIPKIIYIVGERLLELANCHQVDKNPDNDRCASQISYKLHGESFSNYFLSANSKDEMFIYRPASQVSTADSDPEINDSPSPDAQSPSLQQSNSKPSSSTSTHSTVLSRRQSLEEEQDIVVCSDDDNLNENFEKDGSISLSNNSCFKELTEKDDLKREVTTPMEPIEIANALLDDYIIKDDEFRKTLKTYQKDLNTRSTVWTKLSCEKDPYILAAVMWSWLEHLGEPVLATRDLSIIVMNAKTPVETLAKLDRGTRYTTEYVLRFIARLRPLEPLVKQYLLRRSIASLTQQGIPIDGVLKPVGVTWNKMREGTLKRVLEFIYGVFYAVANETVVSDESEDEDY
ncbi:Protein tyrosine phosphatase domain-containing protein 1 [Nymphon striatum]|nr:Protein tyrosine phosphatase domain-containing protein 1 [Nymphon striatum]